MGAWWRDEGQIGFTAFLPQPLVAKLVKVATDQDEFLQIIDTLIRVTVLGKPSMPNAHRRRNHSCHHQSAADSHARPGCGELRALAQARKMEMSSFIADTVEGWSPGQPAPSPAENTSLGRIDPDLQVAIFGTFNPMGPTLSVLGVCELNDGRYLLANWVRHPFSPEYRALLVLPDLDPVTLQAALADILPHLSINAATEFVYVMPAPENLHLVISKALKLAAETNADITELWAKAHVYEMYEGKPWSRLNNTMGTPPIAAARADPEILYPDGGRL